jgi:hypothetical protein
MPYLLAETASETFTTDWLPSWTGSNRLYSLVQVDGEPGMLFGCGTDGVTSFRVKFNAAQSLQDFRDLMAHAEAREIRPYNVIISPPAYPDLASAQSAFDEELDLAQAA